MSYVQRARRATFISSLIRMGMRLDEIWAMILRAYTDGEIDEDEAQALARMVMMSIRRRRVGRPSDSPPALVLPREVGRGRNIAPCQNQCTAG